MSTTSEALSLREVVDRIPTHRRVSLLGTLSNSMAEDIEEFISFLQGEPGLILLDIDCAGGHFEAGTRLYRFLQSGVNKTVGMVGDRAMSAGFMALQGCRRRIAQTGSRLYIHNPIGHNVKYPVRYNVSEKKFLEDQRNFFRECQPILIRDRETMFEILLKRTGITAKKLDEVLEKDKPLTAEEALELGFIDAIV